MRKFLINPLVLAMAAAAPGTMVHAQEAAVVEDVVITGYRRSLEMALDTKREAANNIESIMAEDIGKMPDLNLAESLQRVPGVAITREGGEGRQISVRGLGPDFTRTTMNGMEVPASGGGLDSSGGVNRERAVDFNIFAAELFNRIDIHKTPIASVEEGGLAGTVELHTAKPFDNPGFQAVVSGQVTIDNVADEMDPRFTALVSNTFLDDRLGVLFSVAKSERTVRQEGFGTVRYSAPSNQGQTWMDGSDPVITGDLYVSDDPDNPFTINDLFTPRLPRMDYFSNTVDRTGATLGIQFRPSDQLELGLDIVGSQLKNDRISYNYAAQFRNHWREIEPTAITLDPSGRYITAGTFENVRPRSESRAQFSETDFLQTALSGSYAFTDRVRLKAMLGRATSEHDEEQYRFNIDGPEGGSDFSFDLTQNPNIASMSYGFNILDPNQYTIGGGLTIRKDVVERTNDTFRLDLEMDGDLFNTKMGIIANIREVDSLNYRPVGLNSPAADTSVTNPDENDPELSYESMLATFRSQVGGGFASALDAPTGFPRNWMVQDFREAIRIYNAGEFEPAPTNALSWNVEEKTLGVYGQIDYSTELAGMPLRLNAGVRVVETDTTSTATTAVTGTPERVTAEGNYTDTLPSVNVVWELRDDFLLRFNVARNVTRPSLNDLVPAITSITPVNGNINTGNPDLKAIRADSVDVSAEWYFADESLLAMTVFHKDIKGFIAGQTVNGPLNPGVAAVVALLPEYELNPVGLTPPNGIWNSTRPENAQDADLKGFELAYQQPFFFLPGFWSNFGVTANYTYVDSEAEFGGVTSALPGLSKKSYNFTGYYETDVWGARLSWNHRDDYITSVTGSNGNAREYNTGPTRLDMSAFYNVTDNVSIRLEVINLNEEEERNYTSGPDGDLNLVREYNSTGREVYLGVRATF